MGRLAVGLRFQFSVLSLSWWGSAHARHVLSGPRTHPSTVDWEPLVEDEAARGTQVLDVLFAVKHARAAKIERELLSVSDPDSENYGKHWKLDDTMPVALGTHSNAMKIERWLAEQGVSAVARTIGRDFLRCRLGVADAERLFEVSLKRFRHRHSGHIRYGLNAHESYSVPGFLSEHLDFVSGLHLPKHHTTRRSKHGRTSHRNTLSSRNAPVGESEILVVEARDRAFQVHVAVQVSQEFASRICEGETAKPSKCMFKGEDGSGMPILGFDAIAKPVRAGTEQEYLPAVELFGRVEDGSCTFGDADDASSVRQILCVVVIGPSLHLLNFAPTQLRMRAAFVNGTKGAWTQYKMHAYPGLSMTVSDLRRMYRVPDGHRNRAPHNSQAAASFFNISASEDDARLFHVAMGTRRQPTVSFVGPRGTPGVEGNIDLQWIQALGNNVPTSYWATPGGDQAHAHEPFLEWLVALANASDAPLVNSLSYGENEDAYSLAYETRGNLELAKLGLRGITVLSATGDTGIQGAAQQGGAPPRCAPFTPVWPASSPFVTAIGATMISNHVIKVCNNNQLYAMGTNSSMPFGCSEMAVGEILCSVDRGSMITGGGGFSDRFPRPSYQDSVVEEFLSYVGLNRSLFNASGRAYPDISAVGENIPIFFDGRLTMVGGTSSSSPIVAGLLALINGERLDAGHPPLGFVNPLLYAAYEADPAIAQDVRNGNSRGSNLLLPPEQVVSCADGFEATPGWDATTGLGSPNFERLRHQFMSLPFQRVGPTNYVV